MYLQISELKKVKCTYLTGQAFPSLEELLRQNCVFCTVRKTNVTALRDLAVQQWILKVLLVKLDTRGHYWCIR